MGCPDGSDGKEPLELQETSVQSLSREDPLEDDMVTHSNILSWAIPWTVDPSGLQSMGCKRVRHD